MADDDNKTTPAPGAPENKPPDPLGILGWVIGGKYKISKYIGGGGFGEVYDGHNVNLTEQRLVIKFFKRVQSRDKFAKEAKILCLLDHPNINRIIDFLPEEGALVVAYIDGTDGGKLLKKNGPLNEQMFLKVAKGISNAIAYAHEKKIAHRDLKPSNIIIDKAGNVHLIDFGIAKEMGGDATKTAYVALTPMFAAPERQSGETNYNPFLSDVFELGVTLFNLATNDLPYRNPVNPNINEWGGIASKHLSGDLKKILKKATHPNPKKRYKSARELANELEELTNAYESKKKSPILVIAAVVVVILGAGYYFGKDYIPGLGKTTAERPKPVQVTPPDTSHTGKPDTTGTEAKKTDTLPKPVEQELQRETKPPAREETPPPKEETSPAVKDDIRKTEERPKPPPPPDMTRFAVTVMPRSGSELTVDNQQRQVGRPFEIKPGRHRVEVTNPDYPVYENTVQVAGQSFGHKVDLKQIFADVGKINLQVALYPPSDQLVLKLGFNGRKETITHFPALDLNITEGIWDVSAELIGGSGTKIIIDSCVFHPHNQTLREVVKGSHGRINFKTTSGAGAPLLIFWSQ